jgi:hypothetical protein
MITYVPEDRGYDQSSYTVISTKEAKHGPRTPPHCCHCFTLAGSTYICGTCDLYVCRECLYELYDYSLNICPDCYTDSEWESLHIIHRGG